MAVVSGQWSEKSNAFDAGKGEMGKVREKGLRRVKLRFAGVLRTEKLRLSSASRE